jgi:prophage regulatory protein
MATDTESARTASPLPHPGMEGYTDLPHFAAPLPYRRTIRRQELRQIVPLAETTIYEMERRGEFPRRFNLTPRCVVWDLGEVQAWVEEKTKTSQRHLQAGCPPTKNSPCPGWFKRGVKPDNGS